MNNQNKKPGYPKEIVKRKVPLKRSFFILLALLGIITGMVFSTRYVFDNSKFGNLYGDGIQVTVDIKNTDQNGNPSTKAITNDELTKAENSIYSRISNLGLGKPTILTNDNGGGKYSFTITQPSISDEDDAVKYVTELVTKSRLSFFSVDDKPLFIGTNYNSEGKEESKGDKQEIIKQDSAKYTQKRVQSRLLNTVAFEYSDSAAKIAYGQALKALFAKGGEGADKGENRMVAWIDRDGLKSMAETLWSKEWDEAGKNLYNFSHVYKDGKMTPELKTSPFNANQYLIADAPVTNAREPEKEPTIDNSFQPNIAKAFADRINYGSSSYLLQKVGRYSFVTAPFGKTALNRLIMSSIIIISLIIIFLIARYGIFGFVTAIAFALFSSLMLLIFTVFQGEFTLLTVGAIIFGVLLMLDTSVVTFEELKRQLYEGKSIRRSINAANKYSTPTLFDSSFITLGMSFIVFYVGSTFLPGFSVAVVISIMLTIFISYLFIKGLTIVIIKSGLLDKKSYLIGNYSSKQTSYLNLHGKLVKVNYSKRSGLVLIGSAATIVGGIIVLIVTSVMSGSIWGGFNSNINLTGGKQITVRSILKKDPNNEELPIILSSQTLTEIYAIENKYDSNIHDSHNVYANSDESNDKVNGVVMIFKKGYDTSNITSELLKNVSLPSAQSVTDKIDVRATSFENKFAKELLIKTIIALAIVFLFMVIYVLLRFRWTFSLAMLIALLHDGLIVTAVFIIARLPFSELFAGALLLVLFYSIFNKILVFNRMRRSIQNDKVTSPDRFKSIMNNALGETLYRNIIMFIIFIVIGIVLVVIPKAIDLTFSLSIIIGAVVSMLSIYIVFPYFWIKIEKIRFKTIKKHQESHLWNVDSDEEQTFHNINEIQEI